jgi:hypothetical protein
MKFILHSPVPVLVFPCSFIRLFRLFPTTARIGGTLCAVDRTGNVALVFYYWYRSGTQRPSTRDPA